MPSRSFAAFAASYAATPLPGTPGTPGDLPRGSGIDTQKTAENSGVPGHGTPGTRGTPKNDDAGGIEAAPIVAAMASPSAAILGLFPADRAAAPSPAVAALGGTGEALAAAVAALRAEPATGDAQPMPHWPPGSWRKRRYGSDAPGHLWTTMQRPVSWADPASRPTLGAWCGCCECGRWWRDIRRQDGGWRCWPCHPPTGLAPSDIEELRT